MEHSPNSDASWGSRPRGLRRVRIYRDRPSPDSGLEPRPVVRFREKPDVATAQEFIASGRFLWNSGMFVWTARHFLELVERYQPQIADVARPSRNSCPWSRLGDLSAEFRSLPSISVDHAVLEPLSRGDPTRSCL